MRRCSLCGLRKEHKEFYSNKSTSDGCSSQCKHCMEKYSRAAKMRRYGLTKEQFNFLLERQDGRCAICQSIFDEKNVPVIDHDHACCPATVSNGDVLLTRCGNCVRGLLCRSCNVGLGMFSDNVERLASAMLYLDQAVPFDYFVEVVRLEAQEIIVTEL